MANTNIQFYTDTRTVFLTSDRQGKMSIGSANGTVQGLEIEYNLGATGANEAFKISPSGINYTSGAINYTTPLDRIAQVGSLIQSLETPPDATTLQVDKRILLNDGVSTGSIRISGVNTQVTSSGNLILDPVGDVDLSGNNLRMGGGDIINCPLIQSLNNNNITVEGRGTGDVILKTGSTNRLTISETGAMTFQGSNGDMVYNNATNTLTAANFDGTATKALLANNNTDAVFYPVFAAGAGSQSLFVDSETGPFSIDPSNGIIRLSNTMKIDNGRVAFGTNAGVTGQAVNTVAIGTAVGENSQQSSSIAIGTAAGQNKQGDNSVSIGILAGATGQGAQAIAIGEQAGQNHQTNNAIAIGEQSGRKNQKVSAIAIGSSAGYDNQGASAIAISTYAGYMTQSTNAVAIGILAGYYNQGASAIAIGNQAGQTTQGASAIAIGNQAGKTSQVANSICINASGFTVSANQIGLFIRPIRGYDHKIGVNRLHYDPSSNEITYSNS